jgi:adhesin transport system outer membrane protein
VDGVDGHENEAIAKVELNFPFNMGWTARNTVRAAELTEEAAYRRSNQVFTEIEEQVRNAWQNFRTARSNALLLNQQAELASEFLNLAREERKLGKRSLIDVLAGETALLNAQADATAAKRDVAINAFTVLSFVSSLSLADVEVVAYTGPATSLR